MCLVSVQKKLSISVPFRSENLVGNVIWGKRLNEVSISKKIAAVFVFIYFWHVYVIVSCKKKILFLINFSMMK